MSGQCSDAIFDDKWGGGRAKRVELGQDRHGVSENGIGEVI